MSESSVTSRGKTGKGGRENSKKHKPNWPLTSINSLAHDIDAINSYFPFFFSCCSREGSEIEDKKKNKNKRSVVVIYSNSRSTKHSINYTLYKSSLFKMHSSRPPGFQTDLHGHQSRRTCNQNLIKLKKKENAFQQLPPYLRLGL
ncbi:Uncharacterized protein APZ42_031067 [Daphnia magna]|uniref:Uncharacterized protein n=1 Tax=Daphnia magna TaxID=35525 RepID=A0A164N647_9CRUS|nr:Uncharacterized protein APZ42_031067 [Daphnia magna]